MPGMAEAMGRSCVSPEQLRRLRRVRAEHEAELMEKPNVVGVGIGFRKQDGCSTGEPAIVVSVTRKVPRSALSPKEIIPQHIDGVKVDVQTIGEVQAQDMAQA